MDTEMKALLAVTLALIAAPAHAGWLDKWFGSQPEALQCEDTRMEQNPEAPDAGPRNETWVIEIKNDQWHMVSINGLDLAFAGKVFSYMGRFQPLRVTDAAYVLIEESDTTEGSYRHTTRPMTINRSNGTLYGFENTTELKPTDATQKRVGAKPNIFDQFDRPSVAPGLLDASRNHGPLLTRELVSEILNQVRTETHPSRTVVSNARKREGVRQHGRQRAALRLALSARTPVLVPITFGREKQLFGLREQDRRQKLAHETRSLKKGCPSTSQVRFGGGIWRASEMGNGGNGTGPLQLHRYHRHHSRWG